MIKIKEVPKNFKTVLLVKIGKRFGIVLNDEQPRMVVKITENYTKFLILQRKITKN